MNKALFRTAIAAAVLAPLAPAASQERFTEAIGVTEVVVPVRVLVKGEPLVGLAREDFELYDRGVPQQIVGFEVRDLTVTEALPPGDATRPLEADPVGRRLMVLFDFGYAGRINLTRGLQGVRTMVQRDLRPVDRVAVATWGPLSGVNVLVGFTRDPRKLDLALDAVQAMLDGKGKRQRQVLAELHDARFGAGGPGSPSTFEALAQELGSTAAMAVVTGPVAFDAADGGGVVTQEKPSWFAPIQTRVEVDVTEPVAVSQDRVADDDTSTIRALGLGLAELATLLGDVGGQKDIVFLTQGFGGELLRDVRSLNFLQDSFRALRDGAWTLHAIDVRGLPAAGEQSFPSNSLLFMARATGGELVENINDFAVATGRVIERTSIVYLLSFQPDRSGDPGEFRKLEVELKNPLKGVSINHRPGYYVGRSPADMSPHEQRMEVAEWLLTNMEAAELEVEVFAETVADPLGGIRVAVAVDVYGASLQSGRRASKRLDLRLAVLDGEGEVRELLTGEALLGSRAGDVRVAEGGVRFAGDLALPPGEYRLRVLVLESPGGRVHLAGHDLAVRTDDDRDGLAAAGERDPVNWLVVDTNRRTAFFR